MFFHLCFCIYGLSVHLSVFCSFAVRHRFFHDLHGYVPHGFSISFADSISLDISAGNSAAFFSKSPELPLASAFCPSGLSVSSVSCSSLVPSSFIFIATMVLLAPDHRNFRNLY